MTDRICSFDGCSETYSARGLCTRHYVQQHNGRPLTVLPPRRRLRPSMREAPPLDRLLARSTRAPSAPYGLEVPCLIWNGSRQAFGHGTINVDGKKWGVHRLAYFLATGDTPPVVRHRCDVPPCIEPSHLEAGTQSDNIADRVSRDRSARLAGEDRASAKLTWEIVREIRASTELGYVLATRYGVSKAAISMIRNGRTWKE